jgi:acetate kinase
VTDAVLVLNAGASSVKFAVYDGALRPQEGRPLCAGECAGIGHAARLRAHDAEGAALVDAALAQGATHEDAIDAALTWIEGRFADLHWIGAGHRVVHGGAQFTAPARVDATVLAALRDLVPLAPLHQPHNLAAIAAVLARHPQLPQVACFDTAFHHTQSALVTTYALPRRLTEEGVRRYGFHGLSYEYIADTLPRWLGATRAAGRVIVAHLGAGASACAMHDRRSVATTMGFTALDGLPMGSRCGALDPGVVLYLLQEKGMSAAAVQHLLYYEAGLLGVSAQSDDMRALLQSTTAAAAEAIELFVYRAGREIGSLAAALGGLDALVFTAGIGEHAPEIRRRIGAAARWLGLRLDEEANAAGRPCISHAQSSVSAWVIPTDEDLMIARHTWDLLQG